MLFNSATYLFAFLPISLVAFHLLASVSRDLAKIFLIAASLFFYSWASIEFLPLLIGSAVFNYLIAGLIITFYRRENMRRVALFRNLGVACNLALLIYFKYTNFFLENLNAVSGSNFPVLNILLPLGISFFTFQRIAYLVDCARGEITEGRFVDFAVISVFFPQLISGPIVFYEELEPQFNSHRLASRVGPDLTVGIVIFAIGLFKKIVIADNAGYACNPVFEAAQLGGSIGVVAAWVGVLAYTVQLYFDFSGYSDMAIGSARMFGIRLPLNFHSPLRAASIIEYWRRWHMTLNRFMVRYFLPVLSLPLTRAAIAKGLSPRATFFSSVVLPVFVTFVVIGIWHGASWTYVFFGVLHAFYVSTNEVWRNMQKRRRKKQGRRGLPESPPLPARLGFYVLTIACVLVANVIFRSDTVGTALAFYEAMLGVGRSAPTVDFNRPELLLLVALGWFIIIFLPNTQQIMTAYRPAVNWSQWRQVALPSWTRSIVWRPNLIGLAAIGAVLATSFTALIIEMNREPAQFIYFQF